MVKYIVGQIIQEKLKYEEIIKIYPQYKEKIDELLKEKGWSHLIKK